LKTDEKTKKLIVLNLFYEEPKNDRWIRFDRYPRRIVRQMLRGKPQPGGQTRVFLNLCAGLDKIGIPYRINDYTYARKNPDQLVCIVGKSFVLDKIDWRNPILLGAAFNTHPVDDLDLPSRLPIKKILVPGPWVKEMCAPYWGAIVEAWPVGIDTDSWLPSTLEDKTIDVLLYDKVRWDHDQYESSLIEQIRIVLKKQGRSFREIRYGNYREEEFQACLSECRAMIFLCEHESQGIAYQQALSCGVPIMAWDRGGPWKDPEFFPHRFVFEPVTSVPYWDDRCGVRFENFSEFEAQWGKFWNDATAGRFCARAFVLEHLTLEKCALDYVRIAQGLEVSGG
jgi:hypothetical protein